MTAHLPQVAPVLQSSAPCPMEFIFLEAKALSLSSHIESVYVYVHVLYHVNARSHYLKCHKSSLSPPFCLPVYLQSVYLNSF